MEDRHFGHPSGVQIGDTFKDRASFKGGGVHRQSRAGIAGSEKAGAESIVVSGGYVDDEEFSRGATTRCRHLRCHLTAFQVMGLVASCRFPRLGFGIA